MRGDRVETRAYTRSMLMLILPAALFGSILFISPGCFSNACTVPP